MDKQILIYAALVLLAAVIVISLVKKAIKLVLTIVAIIVLISLYNIFIRGVSPIDEFNAYKTNIQYGKDIATYTGKIKTSTDKIKDILQNKKTDEVSLKTLKEESDKLHQYQSEVHGLKHTEKLKFFHDNYCGYLDTIVVTTDSAVKLADAGNKTMQGAEDMVNKLKNELDKLSGLKIN